MATPFDERVRVPPFVIWPKSQNGVQCSLFLPLKISNESNLEKSFENVNIGNWEKNNGEEGAEAAVQDRRRDGH